MRKILLTISAISFILPVIAQNVGIGETSPASKFSVKGNLSVGIGYSGTAAPINGAIIEGNVGIGNTSAPARLYLKGDGVNPIVTAVDNTNVVKVYVSPTGEVGINTNSPGTALDIRTTDAVKMPSGTTAQRPSSPLAGTTRFNTDCSCLEYYDGTQWVSANTTQVPVGTIAPYAGNTSPSGWLICDGSAVSRTTYALLFSIISTTYGAGDGSTTFNLPDLRGRTTFGLTGAAPFATLGAMGGSLSQTPTINTSGLSVDIAPTSTTLPNHVHTVPAHSHGFSLNTAANTTGNESGHTHSWGGWWSTDNAASVTSPSFGDGAQNTYSDGIAGIWSWNNSIGTSNNGDHSHNLTFENDDYNGTGGGNRWGLEDDAGSQYNRATSTNGNHSHTVYLPNHRHWIQARNTGAGSAHSHSIPSLSISGTVGSGSSADAGTLNTGNNTTNPTITIDPVSAAISGTATSTAVNVTNPYQVTNYIIKATNTASASIVAANIPTGTFGQTLYFNSGWTATSNMYNNGTNVGIGTTSPSTLFDVNGNVRVRSLSTGVVKSDANGNLSSSLVATADIATTGVSAGTYKSVTVNAQGQVTAGSNPTTLADYGITDAAPLSGGTNYIQNTTSQQASSNFNISGNGTVGGILNTANVTTTGNSLNLSGAGWGMNFIIDADNNSNDNYIFNGNGSEIMRLTDAGDLGIGVTPTAKLTVAGSGTGYARIAGIGGDYTGLFLNGNNAQYNVLSSPTDANLYLNRPSANGIYFRANNSDQMILNSSGNLGVGTSTPTRRLEVNNVMKFTNSSADPNDGVIGTAPFAVGLNIVGINTDGGGRKVNWWGSFIQNENPVGNSFIGNNTFTQLGGSGNVPVYADNNGTLYKGVPSCPAGWTTVDRTRSRLCVRLHDMGGNNNWNVAHNDAINQYGAQLATYQQIKNFCYAGNAINNNAWLADLVQDDGHARTNGTDCNNFDGVGGRGNADCRYYYMAIEYVK